jgi:hypothetical protein
MERMELQGVALPVINWVVQVQPDKDLRAATREVGNTERVVVVRVLQQLMEVVQQLLAEMVLFIALYLLLLMVVVVVVDKTEVEQIVLPVVQAEGDPVGPIIALI